MKRLITVLAAFAFVVLAFSPPLLAAVETNTNIVVDDDEIIDDDYFAAGNEVVIKGTINGDAYIAASRIEMRGTINGDLIAGANTIIITGNVADDVRVGGNTITLVSAEIGDSLTVAGNELSIDSESVVGGGLIFGGRSLSIDGSIGRGITSGNQFTRIDAPVGRTVRLAAQEITIGENAVINGNLEYSSDLEAVIDGEVTGEVIVSEGVNVDSAEVMRWFSVAFNAWAFIGAVLIGGLLIVLFPKLLPNADKKLRKETWPTFGWGALALFITLPVAFMLMISVIGLPLAVILILAWVVALLLAKFFVGYSVGAWLLEQLNQNKKNYKAPVFWALVLGLLAYYLLRMLPFFGGLVRLTVTVFGMGMLVTQLAPKKADKKA